MPSFRFMVRTQRNGQTVYLTGDNGLSAIEGDANLFDHRQLAEDAVRFVTTHYDCRRTTIVKVGLRRG